MKLFWKKIKSRYNEWKLKRVLRNLSVRMSEKGVLVRFHIKWGGGYVSFTPVEAPTSSEEMRQLLLEVANSMDPEVLKNAKEVNLDDHSDNVRTLSETQTER